MPPWKWAWTVVVVLLGSAMVRVWYAGGWSDDDGWSDAGGWSDDGAELLSDGKYIAVVSPAEREQGEEWKEEGRHTVG